MTGWGLVLLLATTLGCGFVLGCAFMQHMVEPFERDQEGQPIPETTRGEPIVTTSQVIRILGVLTLVVTTVVWVLTQ